MRPFARPQATRATGVSLDEVDKELLNLLQGSFPLDPEPFARLSELADIPEDEVMTRTQRLKDERIIRELGPMSDAAPAFPLAAAAVMPLRARAESQGSGDFSPLWAGQNTTGCRNIPAGQLTRDLAGCR